MHRTVRAAPLAALALAAACGGTPATPPASPAPAPAGASAGATPGAQSPQADRARLERIMAMELSGEQDSLFEAFAAERPALVDAFLVRLAADTTAPALSRANALLHLGERRVPVFDVYGATVRADDPMVRGATLSAAGALLPVRRDSALAVLRVGLADEDERVRAKALQELGEQAPSVLREYLAGAPDPALATVARQLLRSAEEHGAPLEPGPGGSLQRTALSGVTLRYRPVGRWPDIGVSVGALAAITAAGDSVQLADSVEVVGGVIPAAVSPDGRWIAFETHRRIRVRDLATGAERDVGTGLAPRQYPFTDSFLFFRAVPGSVTKRPTVTLTIYDVLKAPWAAGEPTEVAKVRAPNAGAVHGNASALRWLKLVDVEGRFFIVTDSVQQSLPSPFSGSAAGTPTP